MNKTWPCKHAKVAIFEDGYIKTTEIRGYCCICGLGEPPDRGDKRPDELEIKSSTEPTEFFAECEFGHEVRRIKNEPVKASGTVNIDEPKKLTELLKLKYEAEESRIIDWNQYSQTAKDEVCRLIDECKQFNGQLAIEFQDAEKLKERIREM